MELVSGRLVPARNYRLHRGAPSGAVGGSLAQRRVEPACDLVDGQRLRGPEVVTRALDDREVDERIDESDALQHREGTELVVLPLHHERWAPHALQRILIRWTWPVRRRDRMPEDRKRVRRLDRREECAHPAAEAATDQRDLLVLGPQGVARRAKILELG